MQLKEIRINFPFECLILLLFHKVKGGDDLKSDHDSFFN